MPSTQAQSPLTQVQSPLTQAFRMAAMITLEALSRRWGACILSAKVKQRPCPYYFFMCKIKIFFIYKKTKKRLKTSV